MARDDRGDVTISHGELRFRGQSRAGWATHIAVEALDLVFDLGACSRRDLKLRNVLLSHVHVDHSLGIIRHLAGRQMSGMRPPRIVLPEASAAPLLRALQSWDALEGRDRKPGAALHPLRPGERIDLGRGIHAEAFAAHHTVPSLGYRVSQTRRKLREDLAGLSGAEIGALARAGEAVNVEVERRLVTYIGDATAKTLDATPELGRDPVLIIECTYIAPRDRELAARRGHTHLLDIAERAEQLENELIILKHFSLKHSPEEIRAAVDAALPASLRARVELLL